MYQEKAIITSDMLDYNKQLKKYIQVYFTIGNVIPTWPGANVDRGCAYMYDIPELYYSKHKLWTQQLKEIYKNAFLDDVLSPNLVFENNDEIIYDDPFWNFSSTEEFLDNIMSNQYSKEDRKLLYSKWLERIVGIISKINRLLNIEVKKTKEVKFFHRICYN